MPGYGDPPAEYKWKPGQSANPGGKTAAQRKAEVEAAEMAAKLRHLMLTRMVELVEAGEAPEKILLSSEALKLFKDSEDRAHGTPKQAVEHTGQDGGPVITRIERIIVRNPDQNA